MLNVTLTDESIETILGILDERMKRIDEEANAWEVCDMLGDDIGLEGHHARWLDMKTEHMGILTGLRLAFTCSESITIDGQLRRGAGIKYNYETRKHELKEF